MEQDLQPRMRFSVTVTVRPVTISILNVEVMIFLDPDPDMVGEFPVCLTVEDDNREQVLYKEHYRLTGTSKLRFPLVAVHEPLPPRCFITIESDGRFPRETVLPISLKNIILPEKSHLPTELLRLQPLTVAALGEPRYETIYPHIHELNSIQTQLFPVLYNTDDNILVAAPPCSGKTLCAELAILRNLKKRPNSKILYIAPMEALAKVKYDDWKRRFGEGLGVHVVELSGETVATDLKLLERGQIIISTPEKWDVLSFTWKEHTHVRKVRLLILDELHLIGGYKGATLEVIVMRMRYIGRELRKNIRMVGLSPSLRNAQDLGSFIGAKSSRIFNFSGHARPVRLRIRMQVTWPTQMMRAANSAVVDFATDRPAIIFAHTWKHVVDTAHYMATSEPEQPIPGEAVSDFNKIKDYSLMHLVRYGVGYLHENLLSADQEIVKTLFNAGVIQVLVMTSSMSWGVPLSAHLVVIMGSQESDELENRHYSFADLLKMMGHAGRPPVDNSGMFVLICNKARKEYYSEFIRDGYMHVESHLQHFLPNILNAEIAYGAIKSMQDAVDYLSRSFMYRRMANNPAYYDLDAVTPQHLSIHLSEHVENCVDDLKARRCVALGEGYSLSPLSLGTVTARHHTCYSTAWCFSTSLNSGVQLADMLKILASASEFESRPIRASVFKETRRLIDDRYFNANAAYPMMSPSRRYTNGHVKAHALLRAQFARAFIGTSLLSDHQEVVVCARRLVECMVDLSYIHGSSRVAVLAMFVSKMITQAMWYYEPIFVQLPHFTRILAGRCECCTFQDFVKLTDARKRDLLRLRLTELQLREIDRFIDRLPVIRLNCDIVDGENITTAGGNIKVLVSISRLGEAGPVNAPRYPKQRDEGWWLVFSDAEGDRLLKIYKIGFEESYTARLDFPLLPPIKAGENKFSIDCICDSYVGCDKKKGFTIDIKEAADGC